MTQEEQLAIQAKAKEYAEKRTKDAPDIISQRVFKEVLYVAYLSGAGLRTVE